MLVICELKLIESKDLSLYKKLEISSDKRLMKLQQHVSRELILKSDNTMNETLLNTLRICKTEVLINIITDALNHIKDLNTKLSIRGHQIGRSSMFMEETFR